MSPHRTLGRHRRHRRCLVAASTLLALTGVTACGGDDDDPSDDADKAASSSGATPSAASSATSSATDRATDTATQGSSEPAARAAGEQIDAAEFIEVYETAVEQATSANVTMAQTASGLEGEGAIDFAGDPVAMQMTASLASMGDIELRLVDNVMYMLLPMLGDKFVAFDLDDPDNPLGSSFADLIDPGAMLSVFAEGIESATYVGEEDVAGEPMDHYTVASDPSAMLEDLELPEGAPSIDLPETQTVDVWFDGDGFFRRVETGLGELGTTTLTYDDWGTEVSVEAPPADQVTTMPGTPTA